MYQGICKFLDFLMYRTFVHFILEPLYKIYSAVISQNPENLKKTLNELGVYLKKSEYSLDIRPLIKLVLPLFFGNCNGWVDIVVKNIPSPAAAAKTKVCIS